MKKLQLVFLFLVISITGYTQQDQESISKKEVYKDTLGNIITPEAFKAIMKSGLYGDSYETLGNNITHMPINKKAYQEFMEQVQKFRNNLINTPFPNFSLKKTDGTEVNSASLNGKIVVFNYWFIACKPCVTEMPLLNEVVDYYKSKSDILFLAPALDDQEKLIQFVSNHPFSYQVLPSSREIAKRINISSYPTHIIVDSKGVIKEIMVGGRENIKKSLIEAIDKVCNQ